MVTETQNAFQNKTLKKPTPFSKIYILILFFIDLFFSTGDVVLAITITDADVSSPNNNIAVEIPENVPFSINSSWHVVIADKLNFMERNSYLFTVVAKDGGSAGSGKKASVSVNVSVQSGNIRCNSSDKI